MTKTRTRYSAEFKHQAVELLESGDKSGTELARELGIRQNQLYKWREELTRKGDAAFNGEK
jgi:transposase